MDRIVFTHRVFVSGIQRTRQGIQDIIGKFSNRFPGGLLPLRRICPPFADYVLDPNSVFMSLDLQES